MSVEAKHNFDGKRFSIQLLNREIMSKKFPPRLLYLESRMYNLRINSFHPRYVGDIKDRFLRAYKSRG